MKSDPIMIKAARLIRQSKYAEAIQVLESGAFHYHNSFRYYYILGVACLHGEDFSGAFTYFKRARDIKMRDPGVLLGMAVLFLRRGDTDRAVDLYLEVQELEGDNPIARKALKVIRRHGDAEAILFWIEAGNLPKLYPPFPPMPVAASRIAIPVISGVLGLIVIGTILVKLNVLSLPFVEQAPSPRSTISGTLLERSDREKPVQTGGSFRYVLTGRDVLDTYEEGRRLFTQYRDEAAKVALNRLIDSNASEAIKNKALLLISYTGVPGFDTLKDRFSYAEVIRDPGLYRDCYVIWRGMAANLDTPQTGASFDLLVGYDTRRSLEGIVPVTFDFSVPVNVEQPLEVLGRVIPVSTPSGFDIRLEGIALHQSGLLQSIGNTDGNSTP